MKKGLTFMILLLILIFAYNYREEIVVLYNEYLTPNEKKPITFKNNEYARDYSFSYVSLTSNFVPQNKEDIINIYYTAVNSGMNSFTFYCPSSYNECINEVNDVANDQVLLSNINNFVHPYNSFKSLKTEISTNGKITIMNEKVYDDEMIIVLKYKVDEIYNQVVKENDTMKNKIQKIHNYIINNTKYDKDRSDNKITKYKSDNAYGALIEHYALCGGYTDAMMLFLEKLGVKSIKISNENHVWNYVYVGNEWLHLDLTWDDPVTQDGSNILDNTYFLLTTKELKSKDKKEHGFDENIYKN